MTQFLPPNLLALFAARDPIPFLPPLTKLSHEKKTNGYEGVGKFLDQFEDPADTPPKAKVETREERKERKRREKAEQHAYKLEQEIAVWNPNEVDGGTTDPYKTLFVGRVNFDSSESKLRREFESYGPIKKITLVHNKKTGKPRGYAFVEYEHERDMRSAYKHADGKKIDGRRVLVDVERGRTVKGWLPRRLGGGLGGTRRGGPEVNVKISGREDSERDRHREKDVDRGRDRDDRRGDRRERDKSRERDEGPRHRERDRENRGDRRRSRDRGDRDRDRERKRNRRSRSRDRKDKENPEEGEERARKRSRSREKKRHRSRSKDKDRKRDKRDKERDRDKDRERKEKVKEDVDFTRVKIKEEPVDEGYSQYENPYQDFQGAYIKSEGENGEGEEEGRRNEEFDNFNGERY